MRDPQTNVARLYRIVMPNHICPYGLKSRHLLKRRGYAIEDHWLTTRAETDAFKERYGVETTPQAFIGSIRIGGYDDLRRHYRLPVREAGDESYRPALVTWLTAAILALGISYVMLGAPLTRFAAECFVSIAITLLAMLKLQDIERFSTAFLNHDLLGQRWVPYAYLYPFGQFVAGALMTAHLLPWLSVPIAAFLGTVGTISLIRSILAGRRAAGDGATAGTAGPFVVTSLIENLVMIGLAVWMAAKLL